MTLPQRLSTWSKSNFIKNHVESQECMFFVFQNRDWNVSVLFLFRKTCCDWIEVPCSIVFQLLLPSSTTQWSKSYCAYCSWHLIGFWNAGGTFFSFFYGNCDLHGSFGISMSPFATHGDWVFVSFHSSAWVFTLFDPTFHRKKCSIPEMSCMNSRNISLMTRL